MQSTVLLAVTLSLFITGATIAAEPQWAVRRVSHNETIPAKQTFKQVGSQTTGGPLQWRSPNADAEEATRVANPPGTLKQVQGEVELTIPQIDGAAGFQPPSFDTPSFEPPPISQTSPAFNSPQASGPLERVAARPEDERSVLEPPTSKSAVEFTSPGPPIEASTPLTAAAPSAEERSAEEVTGEPSTLSDIFSEPLAPQTIVQGSDAPSTTPFTPSPPTGRRGTASSKRCDPDVIQKAIDNEATTCDEFLRKLRQTSLNDVCLDITPIYRPQAGVPLVNCRQSDAKMLLDLKECLAKLEARDWRDWNGNSLLNGRMVDYYGNRVHVDDGTGSIAAIRYNQLSAADQSYVQQVWALPGECGLNGGIHPGRNWIASTFTWKASAVCHKPLYFEDRRLERYGHSRGPLVQPLASGAHFFGSLLVLPYSAGIHPVNECIYDLGDYRPGNCAPYLRDPIPISPRGAAYMSGAYVGGIFLVP